MKRRFLKSIDEWTGTGLLSVVGPTGSGKTGLVLRELAKRFKNDRDLVQLVSVDAVAVYRELDIGSAKPLGEEREGFDWIGLDLLAPTEVATAAGFVKTIHPQILAAFRAGRPVVGVGGSHFYERALFEGMSPGEASDPEFQASLVDLSGDELHRRISSFDKRWGERLHPNDRYRLTRYLDLVERQGLAYDDLFSAAPDATTYPWGEIPTLALGLESDAEAHARKLSARIDEMWRQDWVEETRSLVARYGTQAPALGSVGYREIAAGLAANQSENEMKEAVLIAHRQLAKKQRTWLRGLIAKGASPK